MAFTIVPGSGLYVDFSLGHVRGKYGSIRGAQAGFASPYPNSPCDPITPVHTWYDRLTPSLMSSPLTAFWGQPCIYYWISQEATVSCASCLLGVSIVQGVSPLLYGVPSSGTSQSVLPPP